MSVILIRGYKYLFYSIENDDCFVVEVVKNEKINQLDSFKVGF